MYNAKKQLKLPQYQNCFSICDAATRYLTHSKLAGLQTMGHSDSFCDQTLPKILRGHE